MVAAARDINLTTGIWSWRLDVSRDVMVVLSRLDVGIVQHRVRCNTRVQYYTRGGRAGPQPHVLQYVDTYCNTPAGNVVVALYHKL